MQAAMCRKFNVRPVVVSGDAVVGVASNVRDGVWPLNGLRHRPEGGSSGWFIWAGEELSDAPGFFMPLHLSHLQEWCPAVLPYLGLPPSFRFLIAPDYEDVWEDAALLERESP